MTNHKIFTLLFLFENSRRFKDLIRYTAYHDTLKIYVHLKSQYSISRIVL